MNECTQEQKITNQFPIFLYGSETSNQTFQSINCLRLLCSWDISISPPSSKRPNALEVQRPTLHMTNAFACDRFKVVKVNDTETPRGEHLCIWPIHQWHWDPAPGLELSLLQDDLLSFCACFRSTWEKLVKSNILNSDEMFENRAMTYRISPRVWLHHYLLV